MSYWRGAGYGEKNGVDGESLSCKLHIRVDPTKPLQVTHTPPLKDKDAQWVDEAVRSDCLSVEKLLVSASGIRTKYRLQEVWKIMKPMLGQPECIISGSPCVLHLPISGPHASEELLVSVSTHSGLFLAQVPGMEPPVLEDIQQCLNKDPNKIESFLAELRFWIHLHCCEKALQYLPATVSQHLPLILPPEHELSRFTKHKIFIKLWRHQNYYIVVRFSENPSNRCEIMANYYLMTVEPQPLEDDNAQQKVVMTTSLPKFYLKIMDFFSLEDGTSMQGPRKEIDCHHHGMRKKRKMDSSAVKVMPIVLSPPELVNIVAMFDERLPYSALCRELDKRGVHHGGIQTEAHGSNYQVKILRLPVPDSNEASVFSTLQSALLSCTMRLADLGRECNKRNNRQRWNNRHGKGARTWVVEFIYFKCPITSVCPKEKGTCRHLYYDYPFDFGTDTTKQLKEVCDDMLRNWCIMGYLYKVVLDFADELKYDQCNMFPMTMEIKSFTYDTVVLGYGPNKAYNVSITWNPYSKCYQLSFGADWQTVSASNPHRIAAVQLQSEFNKHLSIKALLQHLHETFTPLYAISKLPTSTGGLPTSNKKATPELMFTTLPQTSSHFRVMYKNTYCLDIQCQPGHLVCVRDGAYSVFDKKKTLEGLSIIRNLKEFLSKFLDKKEIQARLKSCMENNDPVSPHPGQGSVQDRFSSGQDTPAPFRSQEHSSSLRFPLPMTHPPGSDPPPHNPLSKGYGTSVNSNFPVASPASFESDTSSMSTPYSPAQSTGNQLNQQRTLQSSTKILICNQGSSLFPSGLFHSSWQPATSTLLTHESLDRLCSADPHDAHTSALQRFLDNGCLVLAEEKPALTNDKAQKPPNVQTVSAIAQKVKSELLKTLQSSTSPYRSVLIHLRKNKIQAS